MNEIRLVIHPFEMGTPKESALKPLEEAAEVFAAWQLYEGWASVLESELATAEQLNDIDAINLANLADEIADCIQACCNLAARYGIDLDVAMRHGEPRGETATAQRMWKECNGFRAKQMSLEKGV